MKFLPEDIELLVGVLEEINSHLDGLEDKIISVEKEKTVDSIKEVYRAFHSIKGLAGFGNLSSIVEATHKIENFLKQVMDGKEPLTSELVDILLQSTDYVRSYVNHVQSKIKNHASGKLEIEDIPGYEELENAIELYSKNLKDKSFQHQEITIKKHEEIKEKDDKDIISFQDELFSDYYAELDDNISTLENDVLEYEKTHSQEIVNSIMRKYHSIKGATRLVLSFPEYSENSALLDIEKISHKMEDIVLENLKSSKEINTELILQSIDAIKNLIAVLKGAEIINREQIDSLKWKIGLSIEKNLETNNYVYGNSENIQISKETLKSIVAQMNDFIETLSKNPEMNIEDFLRISEPVKRGLKKINAEKELTVLDGIIEKVMKKDFISAKEDVAKLLKYFSQEQKDDQQTKLSQSHKSAIPIMQTVSQFVRVEREKIEFLGNISGEMITFKNELKYILKKIELVDRKIFIEMKNIFGRFDKLSYDLQNATMALRMTPVGELFGRFKRTVRDLAKSLDKKVNLVTEGEEIQIDRNIIEMLVDPLTHMIRNAIDHGIEPPQERIKYGKREEGQIVLRAYYSGSYAVVEVEDDGRGLNPEKIRYKAIEKGLITPDEALGLPDEKIVYYIFEPGFSTKDTTTEISGRGVGMDVVKTVATRVGGDVILSYKQGEGTKIGMKIPLSLMALRGLLVQVLSERYVIPLDKVRETVKIHKSKIHSYKDRYFTNIRDELIPIVFLDEILFGVKSHVNERLYQFNLVPVVVIQTSDMIFALAVDKFIEEGEYLIKNIPEYLRFSELFTGATIMGDGSIVLIIEPEKVVGR